VIKKGTKLPMLKLLDIAADYMFDPDRPCSYEGILEYLHDKGLPESEIVEALAKSLAEAGNLDDIS